MTGRKGLEIEISNQCGRVISPAAWRHVHMNGRYTFRGGGQPTDTDEVIREMSSERNL